MASSQRGTAAGSQQSMTVIARLDPPTAVFHNAQDYLRAVDRRDLPRTIRECLQNDIELEHYIASALRTAPVLRPLEFKPGMNPGDFKQFRTLRPWYNIHALFVYITGTENTPRCQHKGTDRSCTNMFTRCIVPRSDLSYVLKANFNIAACANHLYQCDGSKCILNGVAQTQAARPKSAATNPSIVQVTTSRNCSSIADHQPAVPKIDPAQALQGHVHHGAAFLPGAPFHAQPPQGQIWQAHPTPARTPQGCYVQGYSVERLSYDHDDQSNIDQDFLGQDYGTHGMTNVESLDLDSEHLRFLDQDIPLLDVPTQDKTRNVSASNAAHHPAAYKTPAIFQALAAYQTPVQKAYVPAAYPFQAPTPDATAAAFHPEYLPYAADEPDPRDMSQTTQHQMYDPLMDILGASDGADTLFEQPLQRPGVPEHWGKDDMFM